MLMMLGGISVRQLWGRLPPSEKWHWDELSLIVTTTHPDISKG